MKNYKIIAKTNGWIASRDINFNGKTEVVLKRGLTLKDAQKELLDMFNKTYDTWYRNWGMVRIHHDGVTASAKDGTRWYEYDSRYYSIEAMDDEETAEYLQETVSGILTEEEAVKIFGEEVIEELKEQQAEPTSRLIYPAFEPQHEGMQEFSQSIRTKKGRLIEAYYYQTDDDLEEYGENIDLLDWKIDHIEIQ